MQPLFHIIDGDNAIRIFRLINDRGTKREIELRQEELVSLTRFQQRVESLGNFIFKGKIDHLQNLREYLYAITDSAVQLSKMGWNAAEDLYAFGDGIFADNVLHPGNDLGIVKIDERTFYLPAFSKMHREQKDTYQFERSFSCKEHGEVTLYDYIDRKTQKTFMDYIKLSSDEIADEIDAIVNGAKEEVF